MIGLREEKSEVGREVASSQLSVAGGNGRRLEVGSQIPNMTIRIDVGDYFDGLCELTTENWQLLL